MKSSAFLFFLLLSLSSYGQKPACFEFQQAESVSVYYQNHGAYQVEILYAVGTDDISKAIRTGRFNAVKERCVMTVPLKLPESGGPIYIFLEAYGGEVEVLRVELYPLSSEVK